MLFESSRLTAVLALVIVALACQRPPRSDMGAPEFRSAVGAGEWELTELAGQPAPTGAGGRRATIRFEADTNRAGGFAGCNRFSGSYTVDGQTLRFGPIMMTKMACDQGMELEQRLGQALGTVERYELAGDRLTLSGLSGVVARFTRRAP